MAGIRDLIIQISAKDSASPVLSGVGNATSSLSSRMTALSTTFTAAVMAARMLSNAFKSVLKEYAASELSSAALESALKRQGGEYERNTKILESQANQLQKTTLYEDDQIVKTQALLATWGYGTTEIKKLLPFLIDLASKMSLNSGTTVSLDSATQSFFKALRGQDRTLIQYGLSLSDVAKSGGSLSQIMKELQPQVNGANSELTSLKGQRLKELTISFGELKESLGNFAASLSPLITKLSTVFDFVGKIVDRIREGIEADPNDVIIDQAKELEPVIEKLKDASKETKFYNQELKKMIDTAGNMNEFERLQGMLDDGTATMYDAGKYIKIYRQGIVDLQKLDPNIGISGIKNVELLLNKLEQQAYLLGGVEKINKQNLDTEQKITAEKKKQKDADTERYNQWLKEQDQYKSVGGIDEFQGAINLSAGVRDDSAQASIAIDQLGDSIRKTQQAYIDARPEIIRALSDPLSYADTLISSMTNIFMGDWSLGEGLKNAGRDLLKMFAQLIAKQLVMYALMKAIGFIAGALTGAGAAVSAGGSVATRGAGSVLSGLAKSGIPTLSPTQSIQPITLIYQAPVSVASQEEVMKDVVKTISNSQDLQKRYIK